MLGLEAHGKHKWNVYADGRIIWQKWTRGDATGLPKGARGSTRAVQQRLTRRGVQRLRSKILATGLFEHNLRLNVGRGDAWVFHQVRVGDRIVTVDGMASPDPTWKLHFTKATPAQTRALASIAALVADPARWLPTSVWADSQSGRSFRLATWSLSIEAIPISRSCHLQPPKRSPSTSLSGNTRAQILTTGQAGALLQAFGEAEITPSEKHFVGFAFDFAGLHLPSPLVPPPEGPALPDDRC